ncbi:hypothetical protein BDC45DRAFT_271959 [Circinella umbellata]|nr:hypothetical protein BDC45DRAFT_271959 [Circinella umbellata]
MIVCEYHYYSHLGLICRHCDKPILGPVHMDLRFHPHCLQCPDCTRLGKEQGEPCFEYNDQAYCRYHFSLLSETHCIGCDQAILKQFVEHPINYPDKKWHPECYMIQKFWNIRLCESYCYEDSKLMDPKRLQEVQNLIEKKINRIWTDVSAFEESSATCISDMLLHVAAGAYIEGLRMATQFVTHLEVLFSALDWINMVLIDKGEVLQCVNESRAVCDQIIRFFHLLAYQQHDAMEHQNQICVTQELLSLVTSMAQNLKTLIRIGLTEALRLESQYEIQDAVYQFLSNLLLLEKKRVWMAGRYWFKEDPFFHASSSSCYSQQDIILNQCQRCFRSIDDECFKKGALRWHTSCFICTRCHRPLSKELQRARLSQSYHHHPSSPSSTTLITTTIEEQQIEEEKKSMTQQPSMVLLCNICCTDKRQHYSPSSPTITNNSDPIHNNQSFAHISRLEQYLDHVKTALTRLYSVSTTNNKSNNMLIIPSSSVKGSDEDTKKVMLHGYETQINTDPTEKRQSTLLRLMNRTNSTRRRQSLFGSVHLTNVKRAKSTKDTHDNDTTEISTTTNQFPPTIRRVTSVHEPSTSTTTLPTPTATTSSSSRLGSLRRALSTNRRERRPLYSVFDRHNNNNHKRNTNSSVTTGIIIEHPSSSTKEQQLQKKAQRASLCTLDTTLEGISTSVGPPSPDSSTNNNDSNTTNDIPCQLVNVTAVQDTIIRHMAILYLESTVQNHFTLDQLISIVETKRSSLWYRLKARVGVTPATHMNNNNSSNNNNNNNNNNKQFETTTILTPNHHNNNNNSSSRPPLIFNSQHHHYNNSKKTFGIALTILAANDKNAGIVPQFPTSCITTSNSMLAPYFTPTASIPCIVQNCILALLKMDMSLEGVFRKNGNIRELNELCDAINQNNQNTNYLNETPIQLAALLKRYLRELPEPLLTFKLYNLLITSTKVETEDKAKMILHMACCMLPKTHRDTMQLLFLFLRWVATFHDTNKMDIGNLARVIAPTIFYSPTASKELVEERQRGAREEIRVVEMLIRYQEDFCTT